MRSSQELAVLIKDTAKAKKITVKAMLSECGLSINTLSSMKSGGYYPRVEAICKIADYLDCSVDYLLGHSQSPASVPPSDALPATEQFLPVPGSVGESPQILGTNLYEPPNVAIRIKKQAKEKGIVIKEMFSALGLGVNTLSHMNHGKAIAFDRLAKIADYLDCSVDYLLGRSESPSPVSAPDALSVEEQNLLALFHQLNPDGKEKVTDYVDDLIASGKYKKCAAPGMVSSA